jgi:F420-0:gamma-glutamyl ligase-like protein
MYMRRVCTSQYVYASCMRRAYVVYIRHAPQAGRQAHRDLVLEVHGRQYLLARVVNEDIDAGRRVILARQRLEVCCLKRLRVFKPLSCY